MKDDNARGRVLRMVPKPAVEEPTPPPTCEALLLDLLERVRSGSLNPAIVTVHCLVEVPGTNTAKHMYWSHGLVTPLEHLGLLDLARHSILTEQA